MSELSQDMRRAFIARFSGEGKEDAEILQTARLGYASEMQTENDNAVARSFDRYMERRLALTTGDNPLAEDSKLVKMLDEQHSDHRSAMNAISKKLSATI